MTRIQTALLLFPAWLCFPAWLGAQTAAADDVPAAERSSLAFLRAHMPAEDAHALDDAFLRENVRLAHLARARVPWGRALSDELFRGYVLPYAQATERREAWRRMLFERCLPLVDGCNTPGEENC